MKQLHYQLGDDFCVFIEKRNSEWFQLCGRGGIAFSPGRYLDQSQAEKEFTRLTAAGYKKRLGGRAKRRRRKTG